MAVKRSPRSPPRPDSSSRRSARRSSRSTAKRCSVNEPTSQSRRCSSTSTAATARELGYAACLARCEQSNEPQGAAFQIDYYASLKRLAVLPDAVLEPYERHALTDVEAGHLDFTRVPFEERSTLSLAERLDV